VFDQDHGDAGFGHFLDQGVDLTGFGVVEARRRLVEQQDLRLGRKGAGDFQALQRAIRQSG